MHTGALAHTPDSRSSCQSILLTALELVGGQSTLATLESKSWRLFQRCCRPTSRLSQQQFTLSQVTSSTLFKRQACLSIRRQIMSNGGGLLLRGLYEISALVAMSEQRIRGVVQCADLIT